MKKETQSRTINVGLGKIVVVRAPAVITAAGVGSCVIVCLYHPPTKTGGAAHIMLPYSKGRPRDKNRPAKFADTGVEALITRFKRRGIEPQELVAKLVGGAQLFRYYQVPNIGEQNIRVVKRILYKYNIKIKGTALGGSSGRSLWFYCDTGKVLVKERFGNTIEL